MTESRTRYWERVKLLIGRQTEPNKGWNFAGFCKKKHWSTKIRASVWWRHADPEVGVSMWWLFVGLLFAVNGPDSYEDSILQLGFALDPSSGMLLETFRPHSVVSKGLTVQDWRYRTDGTGLTVQDWRYRTDGTGLTVQDWRYRTDGTGLTVQDWRYRTEGTGLTVQDWRYRTDGTGLTVQVWWYSMRGITWILPRQDKIMYCAA